MPNSIDQIIGAWVQPALKQMFQQLAEIVRLFQQSGAAPGFTGLGGFYA